MDSKEPVAWAVMVRWEYRDICDTLAEAKRRAEGITYWDGDDLVTAGVRPLYRSQPAGITPQERTAIKAAVDFCESTCDPLPSSEQISAIRAFLDRSELRS
jgi:hypothetical protein